MKLLSEEMQVGEQKEVELVVNMGSGYIDVLGFGEMHVSEGYEMGEEFEEYETTLGEMPENDYKKFDGIHYTAVYAILRTVDVSSDYKVVIERVK